jgi:hypothetical protein
MDTLFLVAMIVEALVGLVFLFAPAAVLAPFGLVLDGTAATFVRLLGSAVFSYAVLLWCARRSGRPEFRGGVVWTMFVYYLLSGALLAAGQAAGRMNALGWGVVGMHLALCVWFGYFLVKRPASVF